MAGPYIETNWVDTGVLDPPHQFAQWAAHGAASRYRPVTGGAFLARGAFWNLGSVVVTSAEVDPFVSERDAAGVAARPLDHVQFVALQAGTVMFDDGTGGVDLRAPCVFACDYARPYRLKAGRTRIASAYVARPFLEEAAGALSAHGALGSSVELGFLARTLGGMGDVLPFASATSAFFYARMVRDLIAAAVLERGPSRPSSGEASLRRRIEAAVIGAPAGRLDVAALCRAERVARSTVYRLFRREGGIVTWDRTRRLHAVYRSVTDPGDGRGLGEIGAAHGFLDSASLARAFRRHFGASATALRRRVRDGGGWPGEGDTGFVRLRRSVESLSAGR